MDRFLCLVNIRKSQLQLLGSVCLLLASKLRESRAIKAEKLVMYTDYSITLEEIKVRSLPLPFILTPTLDRTHNHLFTRADRPTVAGNVRALRGDRRIPHVRIPHSHLRSSSYFHFSLSFRGLLNLFAWASIHRSTVEQIFIHSAFFSLLSGFRAHFKLWSQTALFSFVVVCCIPSNRHYLRPFSLSLSPDKHAPLLEIQRLHSLHRTHLTTSRKSVGRQSGADVQPHTRSVSAHVQIALSSCFHVTTISRLSPLPLSFSLIHLFAFIRLAFSNLFSQHRYLVRF
jgi:hypothetical protein